MGRKRKDGCSSSSIRSFGDDDYRNEMMKLTKVAKSWDFTCSFCFKKFPSAQALGGHQNAHRNERLEEKRRFVRDPIAYRKRAFLRAVKADQGGSSTSHAVAPRPPLPTNIFNVAHHRHHLHLHHAEKEVKAACSIQFSSFGGYEINLDHNLDLTLKL